MTSHLGPLTKVLGSRSGPGFVHRLGDPVCFYCGGEDNLQTPEDKYPVCDMCLSGKNNICPKKGPHGRKRKG